jgi:type II restriction/modification system DNA methylase subunit YeeA
MVANPQSLNEFVNFRLQYIKGREKSEAQTFLDRFFKAFGHQGAMEAGATYEEAIKKGSRQGKTGYADLVWKPRVLIEMKKQGEDLGKHYRQAFDYWTRIVPNRPRYVMLCNFDEFWIYDFDNQIDEPVDRIAITNLPERVSAFGFMGVQEATPIFANNQIEITQKTVRKMGELCELLKERGKREGFDTLTAQRLVLQCVLAMFAEDRDLLPPDLFLSCIQDCLKGKSSYDVLGGLFQEMNRPGITPAGKYKGVDYFNGGLFAKIHPIELTREELTYLDEAAKENWQQVRPAIFGNIFEGTANKKERHAYGMHFTSEADIMKIVKPTISYYWEEKIDSAKTITELDSLKLELLNYRVLDPACGSGNFLYLAYQELKEIEKKLLDKISNSRRSQTKKAQGEISFVTPAQFYGMDINPFAVELAKVTLTIAKKVAIDRLQLTEKDLPLDTLDNNIVCADALFTDWIQTDAIIGNPPFLGGKHLRLNLGDDYVEKVFQQIPNLKDVDYCSYWFRKAHDNTGDNNKIRIGLVGTNSISQGKTRKATLDYITQNNGYIQNAISTQPWSGEAKVHVSIVNWCYQQPTQYVLDDRPVSFINSSLQANVDVSGAKTLLANKNKCFQGVSPVGKGFYINHKQANEWIAENNVNQNVLKLSCSADDLTDRVDSNPSRWIVDFSNMCLEDASDYKLPFEHIKNTVKPERDNNRRKTTKLNWWKFGKKRPEMRKNIEGLSCYFIVPRHSKWFIFFPANTDWLPADSTTVVTSDDFYVLGILTSNVHRRWVKAQSSTLKGDTRYTHTTCFETFPFPQYSCTGDINCRGDSRIAPTVILQKIRDKTLELHQYRTEQMAKKQWGITQLYNAYFHEPASQLYQLHQQLDKLVMVAYNFKSDDDILSKLLEL